MGIAEIRVSMGDVVSPYMAPEVVAEQVCERWIQEMNVQGIVFQDFQPAQKNEEDSGSSGYPVAWFVDSNDDMYILNYDWDKSEAFAVFHQKAQRK